MTKTLISLKENITVGLIQTDINAKVAWSNAKNEDFKMHELEAKRSWAQIKSALNHFANLKPFPEIVLIPELALPRHKIDSINKFIAKNGGILISGIDYKTEFTPKKLIKNQALITIAGSTKKHKRSKGSVSKFIGKTYPAPKEIKTISKTSFKFKSDCTVWLFNSKELGNFGVTICYDLLDLERALMYRSKIHHLFVIAYNQDIDTFYHLAESLCRTLYCNVVICNTGFYGGSLAIKPYKFTWERTIYRHEGKNMDTYQVIKLPLQAIENAQNEIENDDMKSLPPGFAKKEAVATTAIKV